MRVEVNTLREFTQAVKQFIEEGDKPKCVLYRVDEIRQDVHRKVGFWATCAFNFGKPDQFVVELGLDCGEEDARGGRPKDATQTATNTTDLLREFCHSQNMSLGNGKWELF
jgi:hypothetical protein